MDEYFLQYLWKYQKFTTHNLILTSGESLSVFHPGFQNFDAGPDFSQAKIKIDDITWSGSVELHYKASDWYHHNHDNDPKYHNVILHVVWIADKDVISPDGKKIPTLEISGISPKNLEAEYRKYINSPEEILCSHSLKRIDSLQITSMLDKAFSGRLKEKSTRVLSLAESLGFDWEETAYQVLASNFGFKTNKNCFETLAKATPFKILRKIHNDKFQTEALLFGQAGFLENAVGDYAFKLKEEYEFLVSKYHLDRHLARHHWKFSRLRPANFPTLRLAQFHALLDSSQHLFDQLLSISSSREAKKFIRQPMSEFWQKHYDFNGDEKNTSQIGQSSVDNIIINSVVPLIGAYAKYTDDASMMIKAEELLDQIKPESNKYIKKWIEVGIVPKSAKDSQALLYQFHSFCSKRKCLQCNIGISIIGT